VAGWREAEDGSSSVATLSLKVSLPDVNGTFISTSSDFPREATRTAHPHDAAKRPSAQFHTSTRLTILGVYRPSKSILLGSGTLSLNARLVKAGTRIFTRLLRKAAAGPVSQSLYSSSGASKTADYWPIGRSPSAAFIENLTYAVQNNATPTPSQSLRGQDLRVWRVSAYPSPPPSAPSKREDVINTLAELFAMRGVPRHIRSDNGPEFIAQTLRRWLTLVGVGTLYIEPGSPWENGYAESFHGRLRDEFLAMEIFEGVRDARALTASWRDEYNAQRPHSSLGYLTPAGFAAACAASASAKASAPAAHAACGEAPCS